MDVPDWIVNCVAGTVPKKTATAPLNRAPVMVTLVVPAVVPVAGDTWVIVGAVSEL